MMMTRKEQLLENCYGKKQAPNAELDSVKKKGEPANHQAFFKGCLHIEPQYYSIGKKAGSLVYDSYQVTHTFIYTTLSFMKPSKGEA